MSLTALTPEAFRQAMYLDFEGRKSIDGEDYPLPHLAGIFKPNSKGKNGKYFVNFFKPHWKAAKNGVGQNATQEDFNEFFSRITDELELVSGRLVYWTMHEEQILKKHLVAATWKRLEPRLYNIHPLARRYANKFKKFGTNESARNKGLEDFFAILYRKRSPYPPLPGGPSKACQRIDTACESHSRWRQFTEKQKSDVRNLVAYNEGDCRATWLIAKKVGNFYATLGKN